MFKIKNDGYKKSRRNKGKEESDSVRVLDPVTAAAVILEKCCRLSSVSLAVTSASDAGGGDRLRTLRTLAGGGAGGPPAGRRLPSVFPRGASGALRPCPGLGASRALSEWTDAARCLCLCAHSHLIGTWFAECQ